MYIHILYTRKYNICTHSSATSYQCLSGFQSSEQVEQRSVLFQFCVHVLPHGLSCLSTPQHMRFRAKTVAPCGILSC